MLSREKRKIYLRKIKNFWLDYSHNKIGFAGLTLLCLFVLTAAFANVIAPGDPVFQQKLAARYAMPSWVTLYPPFQNLPPTINYPFNVTEVHPYDQIQMVYPEGAQFEINYTCDGNLTEQVYVFQTEFNYTKDEPKDWTLRMRWLCDFSMVDYRIETYFRSANGAEYIIYGKDYDIVTRRVRVTPAMWNLRQMEDSTGAGSTFILRRLYYENFYKKIYADLMAKYSTGNFTISPEFMAFTYEGFINKTRIESADNPIYAQYLNATASGQTNATWLDYWATWNSTDASALWTVTHQYMAETWADYVEAGNVTGSGGVYALWKWGTGGISPITFQDKIPWIEFIQIWNLTFTSMEDDWQDYVLSMNQTSTASPAYERWMLNASGHIHATWPEYLEMWLEIQRQASQAFINQEVSPLQAAPALADEKAKNQAFTLSANGARPTYYLREKGTQTLLLKLYVRPKSDNATLNLKFTDWSEFIVWGSVHGLLGTNSFGFDLWIQLIHGARISLIVGSLAAVISTSLGIVFGVVAGYVAGIVDEVVMRIVDVLLCLPVLPLLLALSAYWKPNVYYLIILIAVFGWQGLARIIRSRVLSIREMPFIESARASGAGTSYLIFRHLIPNVFPLAMASMILAVPGAILSEAALSFLGFGDPFAPTWGKMLHEAQSEGAFGQLAWWYIIPPGLAITFLCVAFVFVGHALDEIVNPRLRRRR